MLLGFCDVRQRIEGVRLNKVSDKQEDGLPVVTYSLPSLEWVTPAITITEVQCLFRGEKIQEQTLQDRFLATPRHHNPVQKSIYQSMNPAQFQIFPHEIEIVRGTVNDPEILRSNCGRIG